MILLFSASVIDIRKRVIPGYLCLLIFLAGFFHVQTTNILGIIIALPFFIAAMATSGKGIGGGDIKLMCAVGFVFGFGSGIVLTVIGLLAAVVYSLLYRIISKGNGVKAVPLAPFITIGCVVSLLLEGLI